MNYFIRIKLPTYQLYRVCEFLSKGNYNPLTKYTIALASPSAVHYNGSLAIVFTFEIAIFTKNNIFIYIFFQRIYSHNSEVCTLDKPFDALCNICLRSFNFTIIFHDDKKDENKVIENARIHVNSPL